MTAPFDPGRPAGEPEPGPAFGFHHTAAGRRLMGQAFERPGMGELTLVEGGHDAAIRAMRRGEKPSLVLVEGGAANLAADLASQMDALRRQIPRGCPMLCVGPEIPLAAFRRLLAVGVMDYIDEALGPQLLADAIAAARRKRLRRVTDQGPAKSGKLVVVAGVRGGLGATTCAMTLAWRLARAATRNTVLLDLDLTHGTVAFALDIDPGHGLRDGLQQPARLDALFIERSLVRHGERLAILSAEETAGEPLGIEPAAVKVLVDELKQAFEAIVVDCPVGWPALAGPALAAADDVVLVTALTLPGLRDTLRALKHLAVAAPTAVVKIVAGPSPGAHRLPRAEFEHNLGRKLDLVIAPDPRGFDAAASAGAFLPAAAPSSPTVRSVAELVALMGYATEVPRRPLLPAWLARRPAPATALIAVEAA